MSTQLIKLRQIADARSGDKGSSSNIGIIAHTPEAFEYLEKQLTAEKVQAYFQPMGSEGAVRYELPNLLAFNFVLRGILQEGGSRSLRLDPQGKALGQILLDMTIEAPLSLVSLDGVPLVSLSYPEKGIAVLTLKRPDKRNALNINLLCSICEQMESAYHSPSLRALIVAAEGPVFCAGMDLQDASDPTCVERSAALIARMLTLLVEAPFVTIAAAQGVAAGGGAGILSACDIVIAGDDLRISYPETRRGLVPAQVAPLLLRLIPRHLVHELLFLGEPMTAERAFACGLVNKTVNAASLLDEALKIAKQVCQSAPTAIAETKRLLRDLDRKSFSHDLEITMPYHHRSRHSPESSEGTRAFLEKRPPSW